jgi:AcrR family transcriptional regulator
MNGHANGAGKQPGGRIDIARIRREQIIEAAAHIIVEQGLHNLSLSKIEQRAQMKRGQLTYYFPTKESILLAVFDHLLFLMLRRIDPNFPNFEEKIGIPSAWDCFLQQFPQVMKTDRIGQEFHALQYTFLAQVSHREDYRERLARGFEEWRTSLAAHWQVTARPQLEIAAKVSPRTIASFIQAVIHGLSVQLTADPNAFDREEMLTFCLTMLAPLFVSNSVEEKPAKVRKKPAKEKR